MCTHPAGNHHLLRVDLSLLTGSLTGSGKSSVGVREPTLKPWANVGAAVRERATARAIRGVFMSFPF